MSRDESRWPRIVLHVDMDAFFAAVEQRDRPELRGLPVIIGGDGRRGVVSTASYEARIFGVRSAMPSFEAKRLCPDGVFLSPSMSKYSAESAVLRSIFERFSPAVEPLSLDEAFLEMTGSERLFGTPREMADALRAAIADEMQLTASVGVATVKFIAKIASDMNKPDGVTMVPPGEERNFLDPLPIEKLWGVGPKAAESLHQMGLRKIGDVARVGETVLVQRFGDFGRHLHRLSRGVDDRAVVAPSARKSVGAERTLAQDISSHAAIRRRLIPLADEVAETLRRTSTRAGAVRLKLKTSAFRLLTRERRLMEPTQSAEVMRDALAGLLERVDEPGPFRLVGCAATDLQPAEAPAQAALFESASARDEDLGRAVDAIREKFGRGALMRASARERSEHGDEGDSPKD